MPACVALLRGINVGGHNKLPMADFRQLLEKLGCRDVKTYIQSGNAVFNVDDVDGLAERIADAIDRQFGFRPPVLIVGADELTRVASENPYADEDVEPKFIHIAFLLEPAVDANFERIHSLQGRNEQYELTDLAFYLLAPDGIARSKLAADVEKCLGVAATARNWRSVGKLQEMLDDLPD
ncbi:MAG: DUF1697 domain-containing protein [Pseudomonadota bacterium]